jgi:hypothetical protein
VVVRRFEFLTRALYESSLLEEEEILWFFHSLQSK